jgi:hypothetical protein
LSFNYLYINKVMIRLSSFRKISTKSVSGIVLITLASLLPSYTAIALSSPSDNTSPWRWSGIERVVAIGDIHGAYSEFTQLLKATDLVDDDLRWSGGVTHLVSLGDLLDRGPESRKVMDLLMRLQAEAKQQGGQVHVVAGNHETMNLVGDLRYVSDAEFAAFTDIEPAEQREDSYQNFLVTRSEATALSFLGGGVTAAERDPRVLQDFESLYPPGYFGHRNAFASEGRYGRWLLTLPAMIVINDNVFVHGGLPPVTASLSIDELNQRFQTDLGRFFELWQLLHKAGILEQGSMLNNRELARKALRIADPAACPKEERAACVRERGRATDEQRSPEPSVLSALKELKGLEKSPMFGPAGPLWYRGSVRCKSVIEQPLLDAALSNLDASRVIVGHTPTTTRRVHEIRDGRVIMLDTGMLKSRYQGRPAALIINEGRLQVQYLDPVALATPLGEGGNRVYPLSDSQLREALLSGTIIEVKEGWFERTRRVEIDYQGTRLSTLFYPNDGNNSADRELAAHLLDQALGFDLVPLTVEREINGQRGAVQVGYPDFLTERQRLRQGIEPSGWCPIPVQQQLLTVYDLLTGNGTRSSGAMGYNRPRWNLRAAAFDKAFGLQATLGKNSLGADYLLPGSVRNALLSLHEESLTADLGSYLKPDQITALLARRDALLQIMPPQAAMYDLPVTAARDGKPR